VVEAECAARSSEVQGWPGVELAATIERLRREHEHLEISAEVLIERQVFVAKGRDGGHPWLVFSSDLARFERALTAAG
jgi:hypothetical protein